MITYPPSMLAEEKMAAMLGAEIARGEVIGFSTAGDRITGVRLASGAELGADAVVLAMGPWSAHGSAWLGINMSPPRAS